MNRKPHVVIIMADQLRVDVLGSEFTPNINKLHDKSVVFRRAYCASPLCVPARGAFFTGTWPNVNGSIINPWEPMEWEHGNVKAGISNLYALMENEWDSWHIGKQHLYTEDGIDRQSNTKTHWIHTEKDYNDYLKASGKRSPGGERFRGIVPEMSMGRVTRKKKYSIPATGCYEEGFDSFFDGYFVQGALKAIRQRDKTKPFLLNAMFLAPHPPLEIPEPYYSMVKEINLPENVGKWYDRQSPLQLYNLTGAIGTRYSRQEWAEVWRVYSGLAALLDDCVGMIINELKAQGMYDDTLILFASDHGEMLGSHCLWQKMCMYEESVRIPLYFKFPKGFKPKLKESDFLTSAVDVLPTLCDYLGIKTPDYLSGLSLMPVINGLSPGRDNIFIQFDGNGARGNFQRCIIKGDYKLIVDMFKDEIFLELYNVKEDGQEMNNLAFDREFEGRIKEMLDILRLHMAETADMLTIPPNAYKQFIGDYTLFI